MWFDRLDCGANGLWLLRMGNTLRLNATLLSTPQGAIAIEQIRTPENHPQRGTIRPLNSQDKALFTVGYYPLLSA